MLQRFTLVGLIAVCLFVSPSLAATIASWDFNDGDLIVDQGAGTMTVDLTGPLTQTFVPGTTVNAEPGVDAGLALALNSSPTFGRYDIRFAVDMTGRSNVQVDFAWRGDPSWRTGLDGTQTIFAWSGDGGANFRARFQSPPPANFSEIFTFGFFPIDGSDTNNPNVVMQIRQGPDNITPGDQFIIDNVTFTAVPEPGSFAALSALATVVCVSRRRKR